RILPGTRIAKTPFENATLSLSTRNLTHGIESSPTGTIYTLKFSWVIGTPNVPYKNRIRPRHSPHLLHTHLTLRKFMVLDGLASRASPLARTLLFCPMAACLRE